MDLDLDMEMSTLTGYQCRNGCNRVFYSEGYRMNHEYSECPFIGFNDIISSSSQNTTEVTMITELQPASSPTSYHLMALVSNGLTLDPKDVIFQGVAEEVEVRNTPNQQQPTSMQQYSCGVTAQQLMSTRLSNYQHQNQNKACLDLYQFLQSTPETVTIDTGLSTEKIKYIQDNCPQKTLSEINSGEDSMGGQSVTNDTMYYSPVLPEFNLEDDFEHGLDWLISNFPFDDDIFESVQEEQTQKNFEGLEDESDPSPLKPNIMRQEEAMGWTSIPIGTDDQPILNQLTPNLITYLTPESVVSDTPQKPKKGRGRPKKDQSKRDDEKQKIKLENSVDNPYMNYTDLPDRRCKTASLQKIRNSISEASTSGASEEEYSLVGLEGSRKRARIAPRRFEQDPDFEEHADSSDSLSHTSDGHTEDLGSLDRRKKNNEASKKSRMKRKEQDQAMEIECERLQHTFDSLSVKAAKLETAVQTVMTHLASVKSVA